MPVEFVLRQTSQSCPEQYDVLLGGEYVGYMRLRHGHFRTEDTLGNTVYDADTHGDGQFSDESERAEHLTHGCNALAAGMQDAAVIYTTEEL